MELPDFIRERCYGVGGCFLWLGSVAAHENPRMTHNGERVLVRRWLAEAWFGETGPQVQLIPTCGNKRCLNPRHLRERRLKKMPERHRQKLAPRSATYARNSNLWRQYGISLAEWERLFDGQGRVCAVCGTASTRGKNWHTDHCHSTNRIRGILCGWCNTGIGKLQESPAVFTKALAYLSKSKADLEKAKHYIDLLIEKKYGGDA